MIETILLIIFIEAFTEILVNSSIFQRPRLYLAAKNGLLGELVHCGYCTSVWVSLGVAWMLPIIFGPFFWVNYFLTAFILHRLSNVFHELVKKWLDRRPISFAVHKTEAVILPDMKDYYEESAE